MNINVINKSKHPLPAYQTKLSAGLDLTANISEPIILKPLERKLIGTVQDGERIAQMVIARYEQIEWSPQESLSDTERGTGGYGSTGK